MWQAEGRRSSAPFGPYGKSPAVRRGEGSGQRVADQIGSHSLMLEATEGREIRRTGYSLKGVKRAGKRGGLQQDVHGFWVPAALKGGCEADQLSPSLSTSPDFALWL